MLNLCKPSNSSANTSKTGLQCVCLLQTHVVLKRRGCMTLTFCFFRLVSALALLKVLKVKNRTPVSLLSQSSSTLLLLSCSWMHAITFLPLRVYYSHTRSPTRPGKCGWGDGECKRAGPWTHCCIPRPSMDDTTRTTYSLTHEDAPRPCVGKQPGTFWFSQILKWGIPPSQTTRVTPNELKYVLPGIVREVLQTFSGRYSKHSPGGVARGEYLTRRWHVWNCHYSCFIRCKINLFWAGLLLQHMQISRNPEEDGPLPLGASKSLSCVINRGATQES